MLPTHSSSASAAAKLLPRRLCILAAILVAFAGCDPVAPIGEGPMEHRFGGHALGTEYLVKIITDDMLTPEEDEAISRAIMETLEKVDNLMSTYRPDGELYQFNASDSTDFQEISEETYTVFEIAMDVSERSGGAFDVTVGPLVNLWGFGPGGEAETLPPPEADIEAARERVGYEQLELDPETPAIRKTRPDVLCDLSGIAKGYATDAVADALEAEGFDRYMVSVAGEMRTRGHNQRDEPWRIAIERPDPGSRDIHAIVGLVDMTVATSGDYRQFFEYEGQRYSHTIDPNTGWPVRHNLVSASVIHNDNTYADAWATALMVKGLEEGLALAEAEGLDAMLITEVEEGVYEHQTTGDFDSYLLD